MNYPVDVDGGGYVDAVTELASTNRGVIDAINALTDTLYACGGMAGDDTGGDAFAKQYDPAAAQLVSAGCDLGAAFASMANLLNGSLANHDGAEHGAQMYPGMPAEASGDTNPDHGTETLSAPAPPSAAGGIGGEPGWWHWIAGHLGGLLWPDADTGKLRSAGSAWIQASTSISGYQYAVDAASGAIQTETSPEVPDVVAACTEMRGHLTDFAAACQAVGNACNDYAKSVDDHHQEIKDELESFVEWTIGIEAAGAVVGFFTLGIGEGAAQIAEAGEVANAAEKVIVILNDLIEAARGFVTVIKTGLSKIATMVIDLSKFINAKVIAALEKMGVALSRDAPDLAGLTAKERQAILDLPKGSRPDPSTYLSPDYIKAHLGEFDGGATRFMTKSNFDRYGIAQADGTSFVMPTSEVDALIARTGGDPRAMEEALGLPNGFLDGNVVRVDIENPAADGLRMPSGNEAGANPQWLPGGKLPTGVSEAVIDGAKVPAGDLHVTGMSGR